MITDIHQIQAVDILILDTGLEANSLRSTLEAFGIQVRMHYLGNVKHLISLLSNKNFLHPVIVLSCHGENGNILIPGLAPEIEIDMPYHGMLTAGDLDHFVSLQGQVVISTGCCLGHLAMAQSFLKNGAASYVGASDYIEGNAALLSTITLLYFYLCKGMPLIDAFNKIKQIDEHTNTFEIWQNA